MCSKTKTQHYGRRRDGEIAHQETQVIDSEVDQAALDALGDVFATALKTQRRRVPKGIVEQGPKGPIKGGQFAPGGFLVRGEDGQIYTPRGELSQWKDREDAGKRKRKLGHAQSLETPMARVLRRLREMRGALKAHRAKHVPKGTPPRRGRSGKLLKPGQFAETTNGPTLAEDRGGIASSARGTRDASRKPAASKYPAPPTDYSPIEGEREAMRAAADRIWNEYNLSYEESMMAEVGLDDAGSVGNMKAELEDERLRWRLIHGAPVKIDAGYTPLVAQQTPDAEKTHFWYGSGHYGGYLERGEHYSKGSGKFYWTARKPNGDRYPYRATENSYSHDQTDLLRDVAAYIFDRQSDPGRAKDSRYWWD